MKPRPDWFPLVIWVTIFFLLGVFWLIFTEMKVVEPTMEIEYCYDEDLNHYIAPDERCANVNIGYEKENTKGKSI